MPNRDEDENGNGKIITTGKGQDHGYLLRLEDEIRILDPEPVHW